MRKLYLACFVNLPNELITFRNKYDGKARVIAPHSTIVFPFTFEGKIEQLENHIETIINTFPKFEFTSESFSVSFDNYLFVDFLKGKDKIQKLHDDLYTGMLSQFLRKDIPFSPHITIGNCIDSNKDEILEELTSIYKPFDGYIEKITLAEIIGEEELRKIVREFELT